MPQEDGPKSRPKCKIDSSHGVATRKGMCQNCYRKSLRGTLSNTGAPKPPISPEVVASLSAPDEDGCLIWKESVDRDGFPRYYDSKRHAEGLPALVYVRRWVYEQAYGEIPKNRRVISACGKKLCVRLECLSAPGDRKNRPSKAQEEPTRTPSDMCRKGHDLTIADNLYINPKSGYRSCRQCAWESSMRSRGIDPSTRTRRPHNRSLTECGKGHPFVEGSYYVTAEGTRVCKKCRAVTSRKTNLRKLYGITPEEFNAMLEEQGSRCKICSREIGAEEEHLDQAVVDHDHVTGIVRGLLCHRCNQGIGLLQDDPDIISRAAEYVRRGHRA
ncbi:endonuclease VII domain-containing protein [Microbispora sp. KK1-11]|uniref:endonuclease VII domain-containing protein n=1 Tax=Microbispora sp. KK1-11 TaxID=2053005 RepID=UPI001158ACF0|nr:hypothetical protein FLW16_40130 [Microbispora sp. KK1-11]